MELKFLGTSAGVPTLKRNVSALALKEDEGKAWYLIDCGEGTQHQIQNTNLSLKHLKIVLITHIHGDHCYGLPGLLASAAMNGREEPLVVIAPEGMKEWFESALKYTNLYLPFEIEFRRTEDIINFGFRNYVINTTELSHRIPSFAYCFSEASVKPKLNTKRLEKIKIPKGPLWGNLKTGKDIEYGGEIYKSSDFLIYGRKARNIVIAGDNYKPKLLSPFKNADLLVHESTYTKDFKEKALISGHSYAEIVAESAESLNINNLILTHFSPRYHTDLSKDHSLKDIYREAEKVYSGNLFLAEDFKGYNFGKDGIINEMS